MKEYMYKGFIIEIHRQPITGDGKKIYFGIWKANNKIFGLWEMISGTESRMLPQEKIFDHLEECGLEEIRNMIDKKNYKDGSEYTRNATISKLNMSE